MPIVLLANLASGATSVIPDVDLGRPASADPWRIVDAVERTQATSIVASPALLERLVSLSPCGRLSSLERIVSGGAPVMPRLMAALHDRVPSAEVIAVYGSTEAEPIASLRFDEIGAGDLRAMRTGSGLLVGHPVKGAGVKIAGSAECGEILVCGDHVVPGYLDGESDAETKGRQGGRVWHKTGDLGRIDERGRLWLLGRCSAALHDGRGMLAPFAVECALSFEPEVGRCALVEFDGRRIVAVEQTAMVSQRTVAAARALGADGIRRLSRIPVDRRHNAKVDYPALRAVLEAERPA